MQVINTLNVNCIYCEDIRYEVNDKITVVGMYSEGVPVPYPLQGILVLPKFCIIASVRTPVEQPLQHLRCELRIDDETVHGVDVPADALNQNSPILENQKWFTIQLITEFWNFTIPKEGVLRCVAIINDTQAYECQSIDFIK